VIVFYTTPVDVTHSNGSRPAHPGRPPFHTSNLGTARAITWSSNAPTSRVNSSGIRLLGRMSPGQPMCCARSPAGWTA
jgi:hypothetical protein